MWRKARNRFRLSIVVNLNLLSRNFAWALKVLMMMTSAIFTKRLEIIAGEKDQFRHMDNHRGSLI